MIAFASKFLEDRFLGFDKDIDICLTGRPAANRTGPTYAYFPALMACCGTLEYLACMFLGRRRCTDTQVAQYAVEFLPQPEYDAEAIRLLFEGFRHKVAHHGIASGVWHDRQTDRRITWSLHPGRNSPAMEVKEDNRTLIADPPWKCRVTHCTVIRLGRLAQDVRDSALEANGYREALRSRAGLVDRFTRCMHFMYPQ